MPSPAARRINWFSRSISWNTRSTRCQAAMPPRMWSSAVGIDVAAAALVEVAHGEQQQRRPSLRQQRCRHIRAAALCPVAWRGGQRVGPVGALGRARPAVNTISAGNWPACSALTVSAAQARGRSRAGCRRPGLASMIRSGMGIEQQRRLDRGRRTRRRRAGRGDLVRSVRLKRSSSARSIRMRATPKFRNTKSLRILVYPRNFGRLAPLRRQTT